MQRSTISRGSVFEQSMARPICTCGCRIDLGELSNIAVEECYMPLDVLYVSKCYGCEILFPDPVIRRVI